MATRQTHMRKVYVYEGDETSRSAKPDWAALRFELIAPEKDEKDQLVVLSHIDIPRDTFPADIIGCAAGHGLMQKIGDDLAGLDKKAEKDGVTYDAATGYADYIQTRVANMVENLKAGFWVEESESASGTGNVTMLLDAMLRAFTEAGQSVTDEQKAALAEKLKTTEYREKVRANPSVLKHYADIQAEKAAARAKAAAEKAATQEGNGLADLLGA